MERVGEDHHHSDFRRVAKVSSSTTLHDYWKPIVSRVGCIHKGLWEEDIKEMLFKFKPICFIYRLYVQYIDNNTGYYV